MVEIILTDANFETEVLKSNIPVLVDFYAEWCGPCKMLAPVVEELAKTYEGKLKVGKINVDENPNTTAKYTVMSIPTLLFVKGGQVMSSLTGFRPKEALITEIEKIIK